MSPTCSRQCTEQFNSDLTNCPSSTNCFKTVSQRKAATLSVALSTEDPKFFVRLINEFISTAHGKWASMLIKCLSFLLNLLPALPTNEWNDAKLVTNESQRETKLFGQQNEGGGKKENSLTALFLLHLYREITLFLPHCPYLHSNGK